MQTCTCCRRCAETRLVPSGQVFEACAGGGDSAATGLMLAASASPRRRVRIGRAIKFRVTVRAAAYKKKGIQSTLEGLGLTMVSAFLSHILRILSPP